jgi:hypothetical protein
MPGATGTIGPVVVTRIEEWTSKRDPSRGGRNVHFTTPGDSTPMKLPLAASVNGGGPAVGEQGTLLIEAYPWHDARIFDGRAIPTVETKVRVSGFKRAA